MIARKPAMLVRVALAKRTRDHNSGGKPYDLRRIRKISAGRRDAPADLRSLLSRLALAIDLANNAITGVFSFASSVHPPNWRSK
jgi:hypothetical protein